MTGHHLNAAIMRAHAAGDGRALSRLYERAADRAGGDGACAFFLTQAWVHALEAGACEAEALRGRLRAMGRER